MILPFTRRSNQRFLFIASVVAIYATLVVWLGWLQTPAIWDEGNFWQTSLLFSDSLLPSPDDFAQYRELSTPLPFVVFGWVEYLLGQGILGGRLFNLMLSVGMAFVIGWPDAKRGSRALLCFVGLLLCPYYLFLSGRLYTEMISCLFGLLGVMAYVKNRHVLSGGVFVMAIASRQYMIAFPAAIALYEFARAIAKMHTAQLNSSERFLKKRSERNTIATFFRLDFSRASWSDHWRWLIPAISTLSIFGWIYLFGGLAPPLAIESRPTPSIQKSTWALNFGAGLNFLTFIGFYLVIPEFILFRAYASWKIVLLKRRKVVIIAIALLLCFVASPPNMNAHGIVANLTDFLLQDIFNMGAQLALISKLIIFYALALLACVRFCQFDLLAAFIFLNSFIMTKAYPWDKYILPLAVVFWYLKSINFKKQPELEDSSF